ncbi:Oxidoreductase probably involved in sulfite reduction [gamma proteobacterium IMCC2047]|nr:Oxidoreductase probably involved in sulfite reduction [gamma proteobacterium IMCC2047]
MPKIIKDQQIQDDSWQLVAKDATDNLPAGDIIVPVEFWKENSEDLSQRGNVAVWIDAGEEAESIAEDLDKVAFVAINFPAFTDGRGYSYARLLRERYSYQGEIRAIGDVLQDQLQHMTRCGFNSFSLKEGKDIETALAGLKTISEPYQAATDLPPLFRRRV